MRASQRLQLMFNTLWINKTSTIQKYTKKELTNICDKYQVTIEKVIAVAQDKIVIIDENL